MLLAQWPRPLRELRAAETLRWVSDKPEHQVLDPLSWQRPDGWQCFVPVGYWKAGPPVTEVAAEVDGLVLGAAVYRSDYYQLQGIYEGKVWTIAAGGLEDQSASQTRRQMIEAWGRPWQAEAARMLVRWAQPIAPLSLVGVFAALTMKRVFREHALFDVFQLLTLVENPEEPPWWEMAEIPQCEYALQPRDIFFKNLDRPHDSPDDHRDLALAFTPAGAGVWSMQGHDWKVAPTAAFEETMAPFQDLLVEQGWTRR